MIAINPERCDPNIFGEVCHELFVTVFIPLIFVIGVVATWSDLVLI